MNYRAEIDGLRALAVLPVVFFHAGFDIFGGGFVGVDVFFVISGYLITTIIFREKEAGTFSLIIFYERRVRRVLPALFFVILVSLSFCWLFFSSKDMRSFSQGLVAVTLFASNLLFYIRAGYFDVASELNPLLHTWSLAVEEQYYLLFPLFILLFWKFGKRKIVLSLAIISLSSLFAAQYGSNAYPSFTFYLLPTRGWEILVGAFVAIYESRRTIADDIIKDNSLLMQTGSLFGFAIIIYSIFSFNEQTPFPSFYALIPTVGTAAVILFARRDTLVYKLLTIRVLVGLGLISYSLYLWHQPIFAIARYVSVEKLSQTFILTLILAAVLLAYLTWMFIEKPFRDRNYFTQKQIFTFSSMASVLFICIGLSGHFRLIKDRDFSEVTIEGVTVKIEKKFWGIEYNSVNCSYPEIPETVCVIDGNNQLAGNVILAGDSHARVLSEAIFLDKKYYNKFIDLTASGCPFVLGLGVFTGRNDTKCTKDYQQSRFDFINNIKGRKSVILHARWALYYHGDGFDNTVGGFEKRDRIVAVRQSSIPPIIRKEEYIKNINHTVETLTNSSDLVIIVKPSHINGWNVTDRMERVVRMVHSMAEVEKLMSIPFLPVKRRLSEINNLFDALAKKYDNLLLIDPTAFTCDADKNICYGFRDGKLLFTDIDHLSLNINRILAKKIFLASERWYREHPHPAKLNLTKKMAGSVLNK